MDYIGFLFTSAYATQPAKIKDIGVLNFNTLISSVINVILIIAGTLAVIYLIYSGIQYITSSGDATKATAARTGIINAIIGIIIILLAFSIVKWVQNSVEGGNPSNTGGSITTTPPTTGTGGGTAPGGGTLPPAPSSGGRST
ncbi:MAG: hypothetical protein Q7S37_03900 [bacterium]|nr:hypothetical protein [bacterium]